MKFSAPEILTIVLIVAIVAITFLHLQNTLSDMLSNSILK